MDEQNANEVEVTSKMIDAGAELIGSAFHDVTDPESSLVRGLAAEVFRAMWRAQYGGK